MFDIISIGDARIDNYLHLNEDDAHVLSNSNGEKKELCLPFGSKVPVWNFQQLTAGNNCNNAVASARLKLKVSLVGNVGEDVMGHHIMAVLKKEKVDVRYMKLNKGMSTEISTVLNYQGERTILIFHQPWEYALPELDRTKWVYFSSVSFSFSNTSLVPQIENYLERTGAKLLYTPGTHQLHYGVKKYPRLLSLTELFIVNLEEAKRVLDIPESHKVEVKTLLVKLSDLGPRKVVITDGKEGSYGFDGEKFYKLTVFPAKLVEMTGSGDAFASGLLAGLIKGQSFDKAMRWGAANGAAVVEQVGAQAGLLTLDQIQERLKENSKIVAKNLR